MKGKENASYALALPIIEDPSEGKGVVGLWLVVILKLKMRLQYIRA
jgi:hypothetical protein